MFMIDKSNPTQPKLISTAPTLGDFPSAVAYASSLKTVCVINGGLVAGVTCFSVSHNGLKPLGGLRALTVSDTTPPTGPPFTASDILFNPSCTALFVAVKGSPTTLGKMYAFPISSDGSVAMMPVVSSPAGLLLDFSVSFLSSSSKAVITDPAYGASLVSISPSFAVSVDKKITVAGQGAICWSQYSSRFNTVFLMDAAHPNITLVDPATGDIKGVAMQTGPGCLDAILDRNYLYVLRSATMVSVLDNTGLNNGKMPMVVQDLDLSALGARRGWQGMAVYPSS